MTTVRSADGTTIAYTRAGQGPPLILVDGALCSRSFGPMPKLAEQLTAAFHRVHLRPPRPRRQRRHQALRAGPRGRRSRGAGRAWPATPCIVHGTSSGAALALEAAKHIRSIARLAVYEPPFIVDGTRRRMPADWLPRLEQLVADNRPGRRGQDVHAVRRRPGRLHRGHADHSRLGQAQGGRADPAVRPHDHARPPAGDAADAGGVGRGQGTGAGRGGRQEPGLDGQRDARAGRRPPRRDATAPCPARTTWSKLAPSRPC